MSDQEAENPLLKLSFKIPFDEIRAEHVEPAIARLLDRAKKRIDAIATDQDPRTFASTMTAMDDATEALDEAMAVVRHLESVATSPELRAAYNAVQPPVSAFYSGIPLNAGLWQAMRTFAASEEGRGLRNTGPFPDQDHRFVPAARRGTGRGRQGAAGSDRH